MKLGILQCGSVNNSLRSKHSDYPEMFIKQLTRLSPSLQARVYKTFDSELPDHVDDCDAYITTGSRFGVNDELAWIINLEDFVRQLYQARKKFIGVCFGHQLIAKALGGKVEKSDRGWGVGISFSQIQQQKDWMQPSQNTLDLIVSHKDQVTTLPANAQRLAGSQFCPNAMFQIDDHFLGIQGHPEFDKVFSRDLMILRCDQIPPERIREGMTSLHADPDSQLVLEWIMNFLSK